MPAPERDSDFSSPGGGAPDDPEFQRAFAAVSYVCGARGGALGAGFEQPSAALLALASALSAPERSERARALGAELSRLRRLLEARRLA